MSAASVQVEEAAERTARGTIRIIVMLTMMREFGQAQSAALGTRNRGGARPYTVQAKLLQVIEVSEGPRRRRKKSACKALTGIVDSGVA